jgi:hypothetical protein
MASYTKRMIEAAAPWLTANPDAADPAIKIPGHGAVDIQEATMAARLARIRAHARTSPEIAARVAELDQVIEEHTAATAELRESEGQLATLLGSRGDPCRLKTDRDAGDVLLGPWYLAWARQAYNVFELTADFTAAMLLTDPATIDITTLRLPYDGILVLLPSGFAVGAEGAHYTKVHLWTRTDATAATSLHYYATDGARGLYAVLDLTALTWSAVETIPSTITDASDQHAQHTLTRIVLGALAYVMSVESAATRRPADRPRRTATITPTPTAAYWDVGRAVRLTPALVQAARAGSREIALQIKHRFIVRGHYRNQPTGPRRSERTRIWIAPFWKGPEEGARIAHVYKLDEAP